MQEMRLKGLMLDQHGCPISDAYFAIDKAIEALKQQTVDAVPVVRCRDCRHRYVDGENVRYNVCELNHNKVQSDEWFCADGERREDER